jgi:hypothetical protein
MEHIMEHITALTMHPHIMDIMWHNTMLCMVLPR